MILKDVVVVFSCLLLDQCSYHWEKEEKRSVSPRLSHYQNEDLVPRSVQLNDLDNVKHLTKHQDGATKKKTRNIKQKLSAKPKDELNLASLDYQNSLSYQPVNVEVYFESLCPDSRAFIKNQLWPVYNELYNTKIFKFSMYAYGNAYSKFNSLTNRWEFTCQHGEQECHFNLIESCVVLNYPDPTQYLPYIKCLEVNPSDALAKKCAIQYRLNWNKILSCTKSKKGNEYQYQVGKKTPAHSFIPWILINGQGSDAINNYALVNLKGLICGNFKGRKPIQCYM